LREIGRSSGSSVREGKKRKGKKGRPLTTSLFLAGGKGGLHPRPAGAEVSVKAKRRDIRKRDWSFGRGVKRI